MFSREIPDRVNSLLGNFTANQPEGKFGNEGLMQPEDPNATFRPTASFVQHLILGRRIPDSRKDHCKSFSEVVSVFDNFECSMQPVEECRHSCADCGLPRGACETQLSKRSRLSLSSALKSLFRRRKSHSVEFPPVEY